MLSQFSSSGQSAVLADLHAFPPAVYPLGRLDADSEGLLLLTGDNSMNHRLLNPAFAHRRTYLVQVEGIANEEACQALIKGVNISVDGKKHFAKAFAARPVPVPEWLPARVPPVRYRKTVPDSWMEIILAEGKNRQVRKMTAAAGLPTLRLVRTAIEDITIEGMQPGEVKTFTRKSWMTLLRLSGRSASV
jgi:23S rRNA pseudouridine2457 synthase